MRRIDFRLDDEWWELASALADECDCSIHQLAYLVLTNEITLLASGDSTTATRLKRVMQAQRQRDRQRQAEGL